jgi:hypothetical protein
MKTIGLFLFLILIAAQAFAMGPLWVGPSGLVCDRETDPLVTGYYVYWRVAGTTPWLNTQRSPLIPQPTDTTQLGCQYDFKAFNLPNGSYEVSATAVYAAGDESGPSNIVPFQIAVPQAPSNLKAQ